MKSFIESLNSINSQVWAFFMLLTGIVATIVFHKSGLDAGIAAGVIGAAVQLFQSTTKKELPDSKVMTTPETPLPLQPVGPAKGT
jgi:hypothetical protein